MPLPIFLAHGGVALLAVMLGWLLFTIVLAVNCLHAAFRGRRILSVVTGLCSIALAVPILVGINFELSLQLDSVIAWLAVLISCVGIGVALAKKTAPSHPRFAFAPKWKEELICTTPWGVVAVEMTMGVYHIYFPDETAWQKVLPENARERWSETVHHLELWCAKNNIPLTIVADAWMELRPDKYPASLLRSDR